MIIPLNIGCEHWELLWYHIFDKLSYFKTALMTCPKLTIFNIKELAKPPEAKVAWKQKAHSQENSISKESEVDIKFKYDSFIIN